MMKTIFRVLAAAFVSMSLASPALADGGYIAVDVGQTNAQDACSTAGLPFGSYTSGCSETATAFRFAAGMQFDPIWGMEASYASYGQSSLGVLTIPGFGSVAGGDWKLTGFQVSATGTFPMNDTVAIIAKLGLASTTVNLTAVSQSATSNNLAFGIGAQFSVAPNVAIRAQYENLGTVGDANTTGTVKVSLLTAGLVYKF